jgi:FG-GAP repeat
MLRKSFALASLGLVSTLHAGDTFYSIDGPHSGAFFGFSLAVGDLDADGIDDFVAGAPNPSQPNGLTRAYSGRTGAQLFALSFAAQSGRSVASGGDVNGDGHDDMVISGDGFARVRSGANGGSLWLASNHHMDDQVLILGDINQDNCDDVIVASPRETVSGATETGVIRFYSGKTGSLLTTIWGGGLNQRFGYRIARAGDVNKDGRDDFLATSLFHIGGKPAVSVVAGVWNDVIATIPALSNSSSDFGIAIAGGKDFNGDGFADIVIGDPGYDAPGGTNHGRVHVYSGLNYQPLLTITGPVGSEFGRGVACVDDVNGDGKADIAIGAPEFVTVNGGVQVKGRVTIVSSANGATLKTWYAKDNTSNSFGVRLAGLRANLDNAGDLLIGDTVAATANGTSGEVIVKSGSFDVGGWGNWGVGFPGTTSTPSLTASGNMAICQQSMVHLTNSHGAASLPALFFIGNSMIDLQTGYGGKLLLVPAVVVPVTVPASGLNLPFEVCDTLLVNQQFRLQAVEFDPGAAKGVSFSQGMWITLGM